LEGRPTTPLLFLKEFLMDLKEYQIHALSTMAYKDDDVALDCTLAGLVGEMGELHETWKKFRRKEDLSIEDFNNFIEQTTLELGDLLWYIVVYAHLWDIDLDLVLNNNIEKLSKRLENGTLYNTEQRVEGV
jgi:NTP pyrophosphatase (non-canonical NTP hydrolase)